MIIVSSVFSSMSRLLRREKRVVPAVAVDPFVGRAMWVNLRAQGMGITGVITASALRTLWRIQDNRCPYTSDYIGLEDAHVEHITPLGREGTNTLGNVVFISSQANYSKRDTDLETWCNRQGLSYTVISRRIKTIHDRLVIAGYKLK